MRVNFKSIILIIIVAICVYLSIVSLIFVLLLTQYAQLWIVKHYDLGSVHLLGTFVIYFIIFIMSILTIVYLLKNYKKITSLNP